MQDNDSHPGDVPFKTVITLVHGTWAKNAEWFQPGSFIYSELLKAAPVPALIDGFIWSGRNSPSGRYAAAVELADRLDRLVSRYPAACHYAIGHSHGGNVILKALELKSLPSLNVACLSTPFFHVFKRQVGSDEQRVAVKWSLFGFLYLLVWLVVRHFLGNTTTQTFLLATAIHIALCIFAKRIKQTWIRGAEDVSRYFVANVPPETSLLLLHSTGDEALTAISAFQFGAWLLMKLADYLVKLTTALNVLVDKAEDGFSYFYVSRNVKRWFVVAAVALTAIYWFDTRNRCYEFSLYSSLVMLLCLPVFFYIPRLIKLLPSVFAAFLCLLFLIIAAMTVLPLGRDTILLIMVYVVTVEPIPDGDWQLSSFPFETPVGLSHSSTYASPKPVEKLCKWIRQRSGESANRPR